MCLLLFFNDPATTEIYTLSLHDALPIFVTTLAMLTICRGLAFVISGGRSIGNLPESFNFVGRERVLGLPLPVILMALVFAGGWFLLRRTVIGRYIYAVGGNPRATFFAGVNIRRVLVLTYVLNGLLVEIGRASCR